MNESNKFAVGQTFQNVTARAMSRRGLLKTGLLASASLGLGSLLAACGGSDNATATKGASGASGGSTATKSANSPASGGSPAAGSGSNGTAGAKSGGKLSMSLADSDVTNFDPIIPTDNMSIWTMVLIYDQVVRVSQDGLGVEPGLAEKWEAAADAMSYTFNLRSTKFHDGTAVTSKDVKYCLDRAVVDKESQWGWIFAAVDTVEAPDDATVNVKLKSSWVPYLSDLSLYSASIYPSEAHKSKGADLFQNPIGSGPFTFVSWEKEQKIVLKKNPNYWTPGQPYLDELNFFVLTDANTRMLQFQSGELDIATDAPFSQLEALRANPDVQLLTDAVARFDYLGINHKRFPDVKVRQAMNYAVDKDAIIKNVLFGAGEAATTMLPKMLYWNPDVKGYPFDVQKAKDLLAQTDKKDGFDMELLVGTGDPVAAQVAQLVSDNLKALKINVTITQMESAARSAKVKAGDYDMSKSYFTTDITDPDELIVFAVVSTGGTDAVRTFYKNDQVDKLALDAETETDPEKRKQMYYQIQQLSTDDAEVLFLYYPTGRTAVSKKIKNFRILPTGNYRLWETWRSDV